MSFSGFSPTSINGALQNLHSNEPELRFIGKFMLYLMWAITLILIVSNIILPAIFPDYAQFIKDMNATYPRN